MFEDHYNLATHTPYVSSNHTSEGVLSVKYVLMELKLASDLIVSYSNQLHLDHTKLQLLCREISGNVFCVTSVQDEMHKKTTKKLAEFQN